MPRRVSLSLDLLQTFLTLLRHEGDAAATARELDINQPSMSKRLSFLQHAGRVLQRPWLERDGKTWRLTEEGDRVLPAVEDIVQRYEQLHDFVLHAPSGPQVAFACGQQSAGSFVRLAVLRFSTRHPEVRLRLGTPRGQARIERVASGALDLAVVSHEEDAIRDIARRPLYARALASDPLVLACAPAAGWAAQVAVLPGGKVKPRDLA